MKHSLLQSAKSWHSRLRDLQRDGPNGRTVSTGELKRKSHKLERLRSDLREVCKVLQNKHVVAQQRHVSRKGIAIH